MNRLALPLLVAALLAAGSALAQTTVKEAWVRGTVPNQRATGAFAQITSAAGGRLLSASSPVAGTTEIHEMAIDANQVARMRALPAGLELPAGKTVKLEPGGLHVMLMDLKQTLKPGDMVPLTLVVEAAGGKRETIELQLPVRALHGEGMAGHK